MLSAPVVSVDLSAGTVILFADLWLTNGDLHFERSIIILPPSVANIGRSIHRRVRSRYNVSPFPIHPHQRHHKNATVCILAHHRHMITPLSEYVEREEEYCKH